NESDAIVVAKIDMEKSGTPQVAFGCVAAALFGPIDDLTNFGCRDRQRRFTAAQFHAKRWQPTPIRSDFVAIAQRCQLISRRKRFVDRSFVMPKMKRRAQLQRRSSRTSENAIIDVDR